MNQPIQCLIRPLTPVHIGSGEEYGSSEFIQDKMKDVNIIRRINIGEYFLNLSHKKRKHVLDKLTQNKFYLDRENKENPIDKKFTRYISRLHSSKPSNEIKETIKTSDKPYIPGSSIKGSIKTSLLYNMVDDKDIKDLMSKISIRHDRRGKEKAKLHPKDYNSFLDKFFSSTSRNSARYNILRFLQISDTDTILNPSIVNIITLKAKDTNKAGESKYEPHSGSNGFLESIYGKTLKFSMNLTYKNEFYDNSQSHEKLSLSNKEKIIDLDNIKKSLYNFSKDYIKHEFEFAKKYGIEDLAIEYKKLYKQNTEEKPLLRVGSGSGFLGDTIALKIKNYSKENEKDENETFYDTIRKTAYRHYPFEFPKSRKLVKVENKYKPLGWTQIKFNEDG
ncbi:MAG: type III-A CRISPR-associated RAMP protein Csm5 [Methanobrevibacter sp. CfCl-M3]